MLSEWWGLSRTGGDRGVKEGWFHPKGMGFQGRWQEGKVLGGKGRW